MSEPQGFGAEYVQRRYDVGYNTGRVDGYEDGHRKGLRDGRESAQETINALTAQLAAVATNTPSDEARDALRLYLKHYNYRDKDWGGVFPELEAAYNVLRKWLATLGTGEGVSDGAS